MSLPRTATHWNGKRTYYKWSDRDGLFKWSKKEWIWISYYKEDFLLKMEKLK